MTQILYLLITVFCIFLPDLNTQDYSKYNHMHFVCVHFESLPVILNQCHIVYCRHPLKVTAQTLQKKKCNPPLYCKY